MKFKQKQLLCLLTLALCALSCVKEPPSDTPISGGQEVEVRLHLKMSSPNIPTYAITEAEENNVSDIYVFFFRKSSGRVYDVVKGDNVTNVSDVNKTFTATLVVDGTTNETFNSYVVANIGTFMTGKDKDIFKGKSYDELQSLLQNAVTDKLHATSGDFVMWGKADKEFPSTFPSQSITVPMLRALARVDIGLGVGGVWNGNDKEGKAIPFKLKTIHIYKPNDAYSFMPTLAAYDAANKKVTAHSAIGTAINTPMEYTVTGDLMTMREIYLPESNVRITADGATGDANHTSRCAIVVGGLYSGSTTPCYYRIDFNDNATLRKLIDVLRNHRYLVNIVSVTGEGHPTPDDAYNAITTTMNAEITAWSDLSQDIIFDGVNWVYVQKKTLTLPGSKDMVGGLVVGSNLSADDWQMSFDGVNFTTDPTISNADFDVAKPAVNDGGVLAVRTRNTITDDVTRLSTLHIKIGRLKFTISTQQLPDTPADWEEGTEYPKEF